MTYSSGRSKKFIWILLPLLGLLTVFLISITYQVLSYSRPLELPTPWVKSTREANNLWLPQAEASSSTAPIPNLTSKSVLFTEINSGRVLYQKNEHLRLPIASLTKIMTAIVALENGSWDQRITVSSRAAGMEPDSMYLRAGETLTVEELLYGLFLVSGNDAAEALAEGVTGDREHFIRLMNDKAKLLGMKDTLFINPSGLDEDGRVHYSTAYDVALMSRYAIKYHPRLVNITSTPHILIPETDTHRPYELYSGINLLTTYTGVLGFKTGFTPDAGLTLVTYAKKGENQVVGVLLNSQNRREEAKQLLNYSFEKLEGVIWLSEL